MSYDRKGFAERLTREMTARGLSVPQLSEEARRRADGVRGTSYGSIWAYVKGEGPETPPRREVLEALAEVLQVLPDWLLEGEGPRTAEEAAREMLQRAEETDEQMRRAVHQIKAMKRARKDLPWLQPGTEYILEALVMQFFRAGSRKLEDYPPGQVEEATRLLGWLMSVPGEAMGVRAWKNRPGGGEEISLAMATALRLAMPRPGEGTPLNALHNLRMAKRRWEGNAPGLGEVEIPPAEVPGWNAPMSSRPRYPGSSHREKAGS